MTAEQIYKMLQGLGFPVAGFCERHSDLDGEVRFQGTDTHIRISPHGACIVWATEEGDIRFGRQAFRHLYPLVVALGRPEDGRYAPVCPH